MEESSIDAMDGSVSIPQGFHDLRSRVGTILLHAVRNCSEDGKELIQNLLQEHSRYTRYYSGTNEAFENYLLCAMIRACYIWNVQDESIVTDVVYRFYKFNRNFMWLFIVWRSQHSKAIMPSGCFMPNPWELGNCGINGLHYYLEYARAHKLVFNGQRFIDTHLTPPATDTVIDFAIESRNVSLLLLTCRYGAQLKTGNTPSNQVNDVNGLKYLISCAWRKISNENLTESYVYEDINEPINCICILLRVIRQLKPKSLDFPLFRISGTTELRNTSSTSVIDRLGTIIPNIISRYTAPSELKHLCRCVIRERLNANWSLPCGIEELTIPETLKEYLDLERD